MKKYFLCLHSIFAFLLFASTSTHAQVSAPSSVEGWTFFVNITEGGFGMGKSGSFLLCLGETNSVRIVSLSNIEDNIGTYTYQATGTEGKVTMGNIVMSFVFTDARRGNYGLIRGGAVGNGYQMGKFSAVSGTAGGLANSVLDFNGKRGDAPAIRVNYRLTTGDGTTYSRMDAAGQSAYAVESINKSTTRLYFNDAIMGTGHTHLAFMNEFSGLFAYKIGSGKAYEIGTFTLQESAAPEITQQPEDQFVAFGQSATFSVRATGTEPLSYQWYRKNQLIAGATQSRYSINSVQESDDLETFHVVVSNFLGAEESEEAELRALCPTKLDTNYLWFSHIGSTQIVSAVSACEWDVIPLSSWVGYSRLSETTMMVWVNDYTNATARTGFLRVGTDLLTIAQQGTPAPDNLTGKTLRVDWNAGTEEDPTSATFFYAFATGSSLTYHLSDFVGSTNTTYVYSYRKVDPVTGEIQLNTNAFMFLSFTDHRTGTFAFRGTNETSEINFDGDFILSQRRGDFNRDGHSELAWQNSTGRIQVSYFRSGINTNLVSTNLYPRIINHVDFTGDDRLDAVIMTPQRRIGALSATNGFAFRGNKPLGRDWRVVTAEDITADSYPEVVLQHQDRRVAYWKIGGATNYYDGAVILRDGKPAAVNWLAVGVADMNADRQPDVVMWNQSTGQTAVWLLNNGDFINAAFIESTNRFGKNWRVRGITDMNFDGYNDLLWQKNTGEVRIWHLEGLTHVSTENLTNSIPTNGWTLVGPK